MMIPDPIERMEARIEHLAQEWDEANRDVPNGAFRCPYCPNVFNYEPLQLSSSPDSPFCCYDCLPDDMKKSYDQTMR